MTDVSQGPGPDPADTLPIAERLLRDKTTPADQAKLVDLFVQGVGTGAPS